MKRSIRLDSANRSMLTLLVVPYLLLGHLNAGLVVLIWERLATGGVSALATPGDDLRPAVVVLVLVAAGVVRAVVSVVGQLLAGRRLSAQVQSLRLPLGEDLQALAAGVGLAERLDLVDCDDPISFTHGLRSPRVVLSRGFVAVLTQEELAAVLEHEGYHVRNLDPLKILLARTLPHAFFYLPALRGLETRYALARELAADQHALVASGRRPLTRALYRVVASSQWSRLAPTAGLGGPETLELRLTQLETGREPVLPRLSRRLVVLSAGVVAVFAAVLATTLVCVAGQPPGSAASDGGSHGMGMLMMSTALICPVLWLVGGLFGYQRLFRRRAHSPGTTAGASPPARVASAVR